MGADTPTAGMYRDALAAVLEALAIPYAATVGHEETRNEILTTRIRHTVIALEAVLNKDGRDTAQPAQAVEWHVKYLRERLAENPPVGYVTAEQARERIERGMSWPDAVALPEEAGREHAG